MEKYEYSTKPTDSPIEVGNVTCHAYDDGIEIIGADEYAHFSSEFLLKCSADYVARDANFIYIRGENSFAAYELIDQSYMRDSWIGKRLKYQLYKENENDNQRSDKGTSGTAETTWGFTISGPGWGRC